MDSQTLKSSQTQTWSSTPQVWMWPRWETQTADFELILSDTEFAAVIKHQAQRAAGSGAGLMGKEVPTGGAEALELLSDSDS